MFENGTSKTLYKKANTQQWKEALSNSPVCNNTEASLIF